MNALKGFTLVFKKVQYSIGALCVAVVSYLLLVVAPQYQLISFFWGLQINFWRKIYFVLTIAGSFLSSTELLNAAYVVAVSVLLGLNIAAFIYFYRSVHKGFDGKSIGAGLGGGFLAFLGAGCASCGTFIATYVLGLLGAQGLLLWLPLGGMEFAIVGIVGLVVSLYLVCKKVAE